LQTTVSASTPPAANAYPRGLRPLIAGTRHAAVAGHPLAAQAAFQILEAGGNAVDAGVAAGLALAVVHCDQVNIAGVAPILIYLAQRNEVISIAGLGHWPAATQRELFERDHGGHIPDGILRTVVPAAPQAWLTALDRYGTMSFGDVASAAIRYARDGFPVFAYLSEQIKLHEAQYRRWPANTKLYLPHGRVPEPGELFVQANLARTLQYMVDEEKGAAANGRQAGLTAARDAFYRGDIAQAICRFHRENGGWLAEADLADFAVDVEKPVRTTFAGVDVYSCGPWCQGPTMLQALNLLSGYDLKAWGHNSIDYLHALIETIKLVFADREAHYGDPRFVDVPIDALLSMEYAQERRADLRMDRAWPDMAPVGDPKHEGCARTWDLRISAATEEPQPPRDTSQICVVDRLGNAFSATPSDVSYDTPLIADLGLCPSSRGSQSWADPRHPSCVAPGKRPRLTPNPGIAIRPGEFVMCYGTPGGDVQVQANLQVFLNMGVFGMDPQVAVEAPRFVSYAFPDSFEPHRYHAGRVDLEARIADTAGEGLKARGHRVGLYPDYFWRLGGVCAIRSDLKRGIHEAGADPRRAAYAVGW
jgi:gamma-glutamyltranspeptidase/glutathione hydrolase